MLDARNVNDIGLPLMSIDGVTSTEPLARHTDVTEPLVREEPAWLSTLGSLNLGGTGDECH